ncbi:cell envelope integrity protein TolA [Duffyella gerundensis]|uniref:cell envelope integrity protein TolA n=1 Tax=Duffyella gerundensis TaxID=1619313 RepID=UPI003FD0899F
MKIQVIALAGAFWLAGCASTPSTTAAPCASGVSTEQCRWLAEVNANIQRNFVGYDRYVGQQCVVSVARNAQGKLNVLRTEGDEVLCLKAWHTIGSVKSWPLPPTQAPETFQLNFKPLRATTPPAHPAATAAD